MAARAGVERARPARGRLAVLLAGFLVVATGCAISGTPGPSAVPTIAGSGALSSASNGPVSPVVGTVLSVDPPAAAPAASPVKASAKPTAKTSAKPTAKPSAKPAGSAAPVRGFTLLTTGGETLTFTIGELDNADEFPPEDLYDRISSGDPIRVLFTVAGDTLVAYHIEDAG
ncbi:MAG TPA: hypothetical protein VF323_00575 [Candidatus Limnocylindrales bacterium]